MAESFRLQIMLEKDAGERKTKSCVSSAYIAVD